MPRPCFQQRRLVFPTHVGMFRLSLLLTRVGGSFPHTCGDVPAECDINCILAKFSPHMWGCSDLLVKNGLLTEVFPTHVGMFRQISTNRDKADSFPHTCGDVPFEQTLATELAKFSPHMWGCSGMIHYLPQRQTVFPTHVGMFRCWA